MAGWRSVLGLERRAANTVAWSEQDWLSREGSPLADDATTALLAEVERTALSVYEAHGLPVRPGHYMRSPRGRRWTFVAERMTPEERWALALSKRASAGWRFATLEDLGRDDAVAEIRGAAGLLAACRSLKHRMKEPSAATFREDVGAAVRLGADWRALRESLDWRGSGPLKLALPERARKVRSSQLSGE